MILALTHRQDFAALAVFCIVVICMLVYIYVLQDDRRVMESNRLTIEEFARESPAPEVLVYRLRHLLDVEIEIRAEGISGAPANLTRQSDRDTYWKVNAVVNSARVSRQTTPLGEGYDLRVVLKRVVDAAEKALALAKIEPTGEA